MLQTSGSVLQVRRGLQLQSLWRIPTAAVGRNTCSALQLAHYGMGGEIALALASALNKKVEKLERVILTDNNLWSTARHPPV